MAEGWAIKALAPLSRVSEKCGAAPRSRARGGLPGHSLRRIEDFVRTNLGEDISLDDLSAIGGLSKRHFVRAFQDSVRSRLWSGAAFLDELSEGDRRDAVLVQAARYFLRRS